MNPRISKASNSISTSPTHYRQHPAGIECITIAQGFNFNLGNAIKYIWRCGFKENEDPQEALEKAIKYLRYEQKRLEAEDEQ